VRWERSADTMSLQTELAPAAFLESLRGMPGSATGKAGGTSPTTGAVNEGPRVHAGGPFFS
jgi:hypothetical protein